MCKWCNVSLAAAVDEVHVEATSAYILLGNNNDNSSNMYKK